MPRENCAAPIEAASKRQFVRLRSFGIPIITWRLVPLQRLMLRDMNLWWNCRMIRRRKLRLLLAVGFLSFPLLAWLELAARYGADVRGLTLWSKTHVGTLVRVDKRVGAAWVYINWHGDYLGFVDESPNYGPYL